MERAVILPGMQGWSSSGCWVGNAVAWQHGANIASVSASRLLQISANLSLTLPSLRQSISAGKKKKKLTAEVHARMKITSGGRRRDYEQVKLPEYVRVLIMLFFLFLY